jgi:thioesterase domain-containing protein
MHLRIITNMNLRESYSYITSRIQRKLFARLPKSEIERRIAEVFFQRLLEAHRPEVFPGRIVLVRATDPGWIRIADPSGTNGWSSICKGGVDIIPMACGHLDFFKEPHVTTLAGHIDDLLNATDSQHATQPAPE